MTRGAVLHTSLGAGTSRVSRQEPNFLKEKKKASPTNLKGFPEDAFS